MNGEKPYNPFSVGETQEPVTPLPIETSAAIGSTAAQGAEVRTETAAERVFADQVGRFLDPEVRVAASDQLALMREFWDTLGYQVPDPSSSQKQTLMKVVADYPDRRLVPTPLLDLDGRKTIAERARVFPRSMFNPRREALRSPGHRLPGLRRTYSKLLNNPDRPAKLGVLTYGLGYQALSGEVVNRQAYISSLKESGQAIEDENGTTWTFPVTEVQARSQVKRENTYARHLHESVGPVLSPESLIAIQLLHQASGTYSDHRWHVEPGIDYANEAVYWLGSNGNPRTFRSIAVVSWHQLRGQVGLSCWDASREFVNFDARNTESGL